jgi:hypothetical protein
MYTNLAVAIVAASASMVTGIFGMWINASANRQADRRFAR